MFIYLPQEVALVANYSPKLDIGDHYRKFELHVHITEPWSVSNCVYVFILLLFWPHLSITALLALHVDLLKITSNSFSNKVYKQHK